MDVEKNWEKALKRTEIIRSRIQPLETFESTKIPYILLSEAQTSIKGVFVRKGHVCVEKPSLVLPSNYPQLQGFEFNEDMRGETNRFMDFLLIRGVRFPSMRFNHLTEGLSVYDGSLQAAIDDYLGQLQCSENTAAGLIAGPEDCWQFSVLIFAGSQMMRSADGDIHRLMEDFRRKKNKDL